MEFTLDDEKKYSSLTDAVNAYATAYTSPNAIVSEIYRHLQQQAAPAFATVPVHVPAAAAAPAAAPAPAPAPVVPPADVGPARPLGPEVKSYKLPPAGTVRCALLP